MILLCTVVGLFHTHQCLKTKHGLRQWQYKCLNILLALIISVLFNKFLHLKKSQKEFTAKNSYFTLKHFGVGKGMTAGKAALCSHTSALNNATSTYLPISNGTRQSCSLSPVNLYPHFCTVKGHHSIKGLQAAANTHVFSALEGNLIFFLTSLA